MWQVVRRISRHRWHSTTELRPQRRKPPFPPIIEGSSSTSRWLQAVSSGFDAFGFVSRRLAACRRPAKRQLTGAGGSRRILLPEPGRIVADDWVATDRSPAWLPRPRACRRPQEVLTVTIRRAPSWHLFPKCSRPQNATMSSTAEADSGMSPVPYLGLYRSADCLAA